MEGLLRRLMVEGNLEGQFAVIHLLGCMYGWSIRKVHDIGQELGSRSGTF